YRCIATQHRVSGRMCTRRSMCVTDPAPGGTMRRRHDRPAPSGAVGGVLPGRWRLLPRVLVVAALALGGCTGSQDDDPARTVQPGAPGEAGRVLTDGPPELAQSSTAADVEFMHGMIAHHAQALRMTALVPERSDRE